MRTLTLSGWGQAHDALAHVCPPDSVHFDYGQYKSVEACFPALQEQADDADVIVGWSLGGQLAIRAIAAGIIAPKRLVLLSTPFQIAASADFPTATPPEKLAFSRTMFLKDPAAMLQQFQLFLVMGDSREREVHRHIAHRIAPLPGNWLFWFDELVRFRCFGLDFSRFPPTDLVYGECDIIVPPAHGEALAGRIPDAKLHRIPGCGHAPHWHDASFIKYVITGT